MAKHTRIEAYLGRLYGYAYNLAGDPDQARDLVQECAVRALAAEKVPCDERAYRAWLFRILRNIFFDQMRRKEPAPLTSEDEKCPPNMEFWQGNERFFSVLTVRIEMAKLPRQQREIIALIDIAGLSYAETAQLLDIPAGTVMSRISRARRMLLEAITTSTVHELPVKKKKGVR